MRKLSSLAGFLIGAILVAPAASIAATVDDLATRRLVEQAMHWQKKGRDDLASGIWQKLLLADPANPDALVELGNIELRAGRTAAARDYFERAKALPNPPKRLGELETALISSTKPAELAAARQEVVAGNSEQAVTRYQAALGSNAKPEGELGLEYYQTLGGTKGGKEEARRGLESLAQKNPGDDRYLVALARFLTYQENTRREGLRQLAALANRPQSTEEVQKAWRQALTWLGSTPADAALYSAYLHRFPSDNVIRERMNQVERSRVVTKTPTVYKPNPEDIARQAGFRLLQAGDVEEAERKFSALLRKNPRDPDALGGLGVVRVRQERLAEAVQLLDQAMRGGGKSSNWQSARRSAKYWLDLQPVLRAQANGSLQGQERAIRQAIQLDPNEPTAQVLLADLALERRDLREAESLYRKVLRKTPDHPQALRGLVSVMIETGRGDEALAQIESMGAGKTDEMGNANQAKALMLMKVAEVDERSGRTSNALAALEDALLLDPSSQAVRLALVRVYQRMGDTWAANALLEDLQESDPDMNGAQETRANFLAEQGRWWEALYELEKVPAARRTAAMAREQKRYWVNVQAERARQYDASGRQREAHAILNHAEQAAGEDISLQSVVATAWSDIGQSPKALRLLRQIASKGNMGVGARLQYASLLLNMRQDVELLVVLRELSAAPNLGTQEQTGLNNLITAYTLRQSDALREAGRIAEAYDVLLPVLQQSPDSRLKMALARIYNSAREPENALRIAEEVIAREPNELEHRLFAAAIALGTRSYDRASEHAEAALALAPDHPRALATAGRVEKARGNLNRAMEYFQYAQALEKDSRAFAGVPGNLALRLVDQQAALDRNTPSIKQSNILPLPGGNRSQRTAPNGKATQFSDFAEPTQPPTTARQILPLSPSTQRTPVYAAPLPKIGKRSNTVLPLARQSAYPGTDDGYTFQPTRQDAAMQPRMQLADNRQPAQTQWTDTLPQRQPTNEVRAKASTLADEMRDITLRTSKTLSAGAGFRSRAGELGMSKLTSYESTLEARLPLDFDTAIVLRITPVLLDAGKIDLAQPTTATRFGSVALGTWGIPGSFTARTQDASGVALSAAMKTEMVNADIGTTPLGFPVQNVVGSVSVTGNFEGITFKGGLSRRPVTDSVLSYAGTTDPRTGQVWGGVLKTGAGFDVSLGGEEGGAYAGLGGYSLTGEKVKANQVLELGLGAYWRAYQRTDTQVTVGLSMMTMAYKENLSHYTLGHGGYFSPQRYAALGLPFDVAGRRGRLAFQLGGDVGVRSMKQNDAPYYPDDGNLQTTWENYLAGLTPANAAGHASRYLGDTSKGLGYRFFGKLEYNINDKMAVGGRFTTDNSRNYTQQQGLIYLRHSFDGISQPIAYPPKTLRLFSEGEAL